MIKNIVFITIMFFGTPQLFAQNHKVIASFKVEGNCEMCEVRIEKAAKHVKGVKTADWDLKTKIISVSFDSVKTNLIEIHQAISSVGYKTEKLAANKKGFDALPFCCKVNGACEQPKKE